MSKALWRTSLHESGHGIASLALGGTCEGLVMFDDGAGIAQIGELLPNQEAYSIAAGPAAESLASDFPIPNVESAKTGVLTVDEIETLPLFATAPALACQLARTSDDRRPGDSDNRRLALWAIAGCEDEPGRWAERVAFAHRIAGEIVRNNAQAIAAVAAELFSKGSLSGSEVAAIAALNGSTFQTLQEQ